MWPQSESMSKYGIKYINFLVKETSCEAKDRSICILRQSELSRKNLTVISVQTIQN